MNQRAYAIDCLRGMAIVGMILSGYIAWNPDLPAWLFHAQMPPPLFAFDPSVAGITWVDLVFPFFLFSMGAAFPLSLGRRLDKGTAGVKVAGSILKRGVLLAFFAIILGNTGLWTLDEAVGNLPASALLTLCVWAAFFALFIRLPRLTSAQNDALNACGAVALLGFAALYKWLGIEVSLYKSDAIILILANVAVAGSFVWWLTRRNLWLRVGIVALIAALKLGAAVPGSWNETVWNASFAPWLYRAEYLQYLCIVLPGSISGDLIARWLAARAQDARQTEDRNGRDAQDTPGTKNMQEAQHVQFMQAGRESQEAQELRHGRPVRIYGAVALVTALFIANMWGLYTRHLGLNLTLTVLFGAAAWCVLRKPRTAHERLLEGLFSTGFFWLLLGLALETLEGGIKKDPATTGYLFVTAGLASHTLLVATVLLHDAGLRAGLLLRCGQNPMAAYTAAGYVVIPLLALAAQAVPMPWLWGGSGCVMSVVRGVVVTLLSMLLTAFFTRRKWFWRT